MTKFSRFRPDLTVLTLVACLAMFVQAAQPPSAVPIGPFLSAPGIDGVAVQLAVITSIQTQVGNQNATAAQVFAGACANWTLASSHSREMGLPISPKPIPQAIQIVNLAQKDKDSPVYVWMTDGAPVGTCPDLPAIPPKPPAGNVAIGAHMFGDYWASLPADTVTTEGTRVTGTSSDGVTGVWQKRVYPFGGWWLKVQ